MVFLLCAIDVFSKYAYVRPLVSKTGSSVESALKDIFSKQTPRAIQSDHGKEFLNKKVQDYLKEIGVDFFTSQNEDIKCAIVERFNRTLQDRLYKSMFYKKSFRYVDDLPKFIRAYNKAYHRTIGMSPAEVTLLNQEEIWQRMYNTPKAVARKTTINLDVGDKVRLVKGKRTFKKGYMETHTREIFTVTKIRKFTAPITYTVADDKGDVIGGTFYREELQKIRL